MTRASGSAALGLAFALSVFPGRAAACSVCSRGDPIAPAAEGHGQGGDLRLAVEGEMLSQRAATPGSLGLMHDAMDQTSLKITAAYSPVAPVNLVVSVPFVHKTMVIDHGGGVTFPVSDLSGLGDVELGARWFFWENVNFKARLRQGLAISAGTSFPTGESDARFVEGLPNAQHGQIGNGSFGPYAGLSYRLQRNPFAGLVSLTGRMHTENAQGYRYGSALLGTLQGQWTPLQWVAFGLGLDGHQGAADTLSGVSVGNTGGFVLWASPSAFVNVYQGLWLALRAQFPIYASLYGDQTVGPVILAGLQYVVF